MRVDELSIHNEKKKNYGLYITKKEKIEEKKEDNICCV